MGNQCGVWARGTVKDAGRQHWKNCNDRKESDRDESVGRLAALSPTCREREDETVKHQGNNHESVVGNLP